MHYLSQQQKTKCTIREHQVVKPLMDSKDAHFFPFTSCPPQRCSLTFWPRLEYNFVTVHVVTPFQSLPTSYGSAQVAGPHSIISLQIQQAP